MGVNMKRIAYLGVAALLAAGTFAVPAQAQSEPLGDYARHVRSEKKDKPESVKSYDNDNLPRTDKLSIVGNAPEEPAAPSAETPSAENPAPGAEAAKPEAKPENSPAAVEPGQSPEARQQALAEWQKKIAAQKDQINLLSRELDVAQREYRLRAAAFYADAGNRLRNAGSWDKEDAQYKQQIAQKQKAVDAAKQQLSDLQEQARKSGVPSSMRE
jgi:hypothetical protein